MVMIVIKITIIMIFVTMVMLVMVAELTKNTINCLFTFWSQN